MKKFYSFYLMITMILLMFSTYSFAQEMIVGGNMEDEEDWMISLLNQDDDNEATYEFGYTDVIPMYGEGGCLYVRGTNSGTSGGNLTNIMFYQELTLQKGVEYMFNGAYKDFRSNNYWFEAYVGGNEPEEGSDYGTDQGAVLVSGYKSTNWEGNCPGDEFDGMIQDDACTAGITNMVYFEGEGDTTVFFGFRMGIWDDGGNDYSFEVYVDNISLMGPEQTAVKEITNTDLNIYPTQVENELMINLNTTISDIEIINMAGQSVRKFKAIDANSVSLDLGNLTQGMYQVVVRDVQGNKGANKIFKM